jgi:hypothetical protein
MKTNKLVLAALLASLAVPVLAEEGEAQTVQTTRIVTDGAVELRTPNMFVLPHGPRPIKNAPYSAQMVTERQQNLSDGNQIADRQATMAYRDGAGRTRQEIVDPKGELKVVTIHDPVAGATWILKPQDRSATKINTGEAARKAAEAARARIEQMRKDGTLPTVEHRKREDGKEEIIVKRVVRAHGAPGERSTEDVRIALESGLNAQRELQRRLAPLAAGVFGDVKWSKNATVKDLGTRDFNGVKAEGKLRSYEIPAGEIGNRNPIVVADETWHAPELQVTVYSKHSDPRSGDTIFRLENLKREEPAASLFAVPSDYTVKDPLAASAAKAQ